MKWFDRFWHGTLGRPYRLPVIFDEGQGRPIVLLHGLASNAEVWEPLVEKLDKRKWRIVAIDLLGFGSAPAPDWNDYSVQEQTRMILATLAKLRLKGRVTFVGHSMGCLVATHIAATKPRMVKRLVLFEPPLFADTPEFRAHTRLRERYFVIFEYVANHPQLLFGADGELRRMVAKISGMSMKPETWIPFQRSLRNAIMQQTAYDELHNIAVPTDIIHGRLDVVVPRVEVREMFKKNPHIHLHAVTQVHNVTARAADYLVKLLDGHVKK